MNKEIIEAVQKARQAQLRNCIPIPDEIDMFVIISTDMAYDRKMGGFVAKKNTYRYRDNLKRAGFKWFNKNKIWLKPVNKN